MVLRYGSQLYTVSNPVHWRTVRGLAITAWRKVAEAAVGKAHAGLRKTLLTALPLLLSVKSLTFPNSIPPVWTYFQQGISEILDLQALEQAHDLTFPWTLKPDVIPCEFT